MSQRPLLELQQLTKTFGSLGAVRDLSLTVEAGEILALIGPSGCGKTTTLRMIAGFDSPDQGKILLSGRDITDLPPERRGIGIVFQDYALFPHLTVAENILFGSREPGAEALARFSAMVGLTGLEQRYPDQLSGGQQQRVALARSFAAAPGLILLDEPFSNLDAGLRIATRREIRHLLKATGCGIILVTHDQEEALGFADRVAILREGQLQQSGPVREVYAHPENAFVARALGRANLIAGQGLGAVAQTPLGPVPLPQPQTGPVTFAIRPQEILLTPVPLGAQGNGRVSAVEFKGHYSLCLISCGALEVEVELTSPLPEGSEVNLCLRPGLRPVPLG